MEKTAVMLNSELRLKQKKLGELTERFNSAKQEFFDVESAKVFMASIQMQAEQNRCFVETLRFAPARQIAVKDPNNIDIKEYQVSLGVIGQYIDIVMLLNSLQNRPEKVWLDNIRLQLKDQANGWLVCDVEMSLYTLKIMESTTNVNTQK
jgi:hypothetical protein